nr:MAG TPA: zinc finger domain protein [Caudoviricetes sp.]DAP66381.1 MAG TPA: zinc finger domain protein [Caudoviricetes sp.]
MSLYFCSTPTFIYVLESIILPTLEPFIPVCGLRYSNNSLLITPS